MTNSLPFNAIRVLNDGFVGLVDHMGDDSSVVQAARISYGKDDRPETHEECRWQEKDTNLIRYLMRHRHTTPFEMVEFKFIVRVPMDCWRQWVRHRTASINEYSTRYTEAIDSCQTTGAEEWRLQSKSNKQGSEEYLTGWPEGWEAKADDNGYFLYSPSGVSQIPSPEQGGTPGGYLENEESKLQSHAQRVYRERLKFGVAREQARKDLPLSTYTEAYWKINLHNLLHFLFLRLDSHAQKEIREYAQAVYSLIKPIVPVTCSAFEDYRLNACTFSAQEISLLKDVLKQDAGDLIDRLKDSVSLSDREWKEFKEKLNI